MTASYLDSLLRPASIAVIGASPTTFTGSIPLLNARDARFAGTVYAVNPKYEEVHGFPCYPAIGSLPESVDTALLAVGPSKAASLAREALDAGARSLIVPAGGFTESGQAGLDMRHEISQAANARGVPVCGPNGMGIVSVIHGVSAYVGHVPACTTSGNIAGVFQSGSVCEGVLNAATRLGFSYLISSGTEDTTDVADYLRFLTADDATSVILLYLEGIRRPAVFRDALAEANAARKVVIVLKGGRSEGARGNALAHSGMLASNDRVVDAVLRRHGAIRVHDLDELLETALLFSLNVRRTRKGSRVQVIGNSGGEATIWHDVCDAVGLPMPPPPPEFVQRLQNQFPNYAHVGNPVDAWGVADFQQVYAAVFAAADASPNIDIIVGAADVSEQSGDFQVETVGRLATLFADRLGDGQKPLAFINAFGSEPHLATERALLAAGIPPLRGFTNGAKALVHFVHAAARTAGVSRDPEPQESRRHLTVRKEGRLVVNERKARQLLDRFGIASPKDLVVSSEEAAVRAAGDLGFPVAIKTLALGVTHKTEIGGVIVGVSSDLEAAAAYRTITRSASNHTGSADGGQVLVQEMIDGVECLVGAVRDPDFGPMVLFGTGGILAELINDVIVEPAPVSPQIAYEMVSRSRVHEMLRGTRGRPRADIAAAAKTIVAASEMIVSTGLLELDINPLVVSEEGKGAKAVDIVIVIDGAHASGRLAL